MYWEHTSSIFLLGNIIKLLDQTKYCITKSFRKEGNVDSKFYNFVCTVTETFARIKRDKVNSNNIAGKKSLIMIQKAPVNVLCRGQLS